MNVTFPDIDHGGISQELMPKEVVARYLEAFYRGDFETARQLVTEDLSFSGPFVQVVGAEEFFASAQPLRKIVDGHRVIRQWEDREEVLTLYDMHLNTPLGEGSVLVAEWNTLRAGQVASARLVFDTRAFGELVPLAGERSH